MKNIKTLIPFSPLALCLVALAFTTSGCKGPRSDDARIDRLENRVTAIESKLDIMRKP